MGDTIMRSDLLGSTALVSILWREREVVDDGTEDSAAFGVRVKGRRKILLCGLHSSSDLLGETLVISSG